MTVRLPIDSRCNLATGWKQFILNKKIKLGTFCTFMQCFTSCCRWSNGPLGTARPKHDRAWAEVSPPARYDSDFVSCRVSPRAARSLDRAVPCQPMGCTSGPSTAHQHSGHAASAQRHDQPIESRPAQARHRRATTCSNQFCTTKLIMQH